MPSSYIPENIRSNDGFCTICKSQLEIYYESREGRSYLIHHCMKCNKSKPNDEIKNVKIKKQSEFVEMKCEDCAKMYKVKHDEKWKRQCYNCYMKSKETPKGDCYKCGGKGHWSKDCH